MPRAVVVILDSFGLGFTGELDRFAADAGSNTLGHIAKWRAEQGSPLQLPHLAKLGLLHAAHAASGQWPAGLDASVQPVGSYGAALEQSSGKDTPSGHWELMGCPVLFDWGYFPTTDNCFPPELMNEWMRQAGIAGTLGNCHASGTEVINRFGDEHVRTGFPICYTSADSVFQVAAHEDHFGLDRLLHICELAKPLVDQYNIARVIARPFTGRNGQYTRTANRKDLTTLPHQETLLKRLVDNGRHVHSVGKINDIFAGQGITHKRKGKDNQELCQQTLAALDDCTDGGMVFTNLVDFDMLWGHRRNVAGYADELEAFDRFLPTLLSHLKEGDLLAISADHGCDPTWPGSDHTREHVPMIFAGPASPIGRDLGVRSSFADLGQTLAHHLGVGKLAAGQACWP